MASSTPNSTPNSTPEVTADDIRRYAAANRFDLTPERAAALVEVVTAILTADADLERIDLTGFSPVAPLWPSPLASDEANRG